MNLKQSKEIIITSWLILGVLIGIIGFGAARGEIDLKLETVNSLPDISGLAWIEENLFLGVHDAKSEGESGKPRVSLIKLPTSESGLSWQPVNLNWPQPLGFSSDLEGVAAIPDQSLFIVAESGSDVKNTPYRRLFLLEYAQKQLKIIDTAEWPVPVTNIEGIAVAKIENQLIFIYAERADNQPLTKIRWATLSLNPLKFGQFREVTYIAPDLRENNTRHVSAIDVDRQGRLYVASAFDPNDDNGPFYSRVWAIATISKKEDKSIQISLDQSPKPIAVIDGFKVEGLAIRESNRDQIEIFIGTDDENYGGVVRLLP